MTVPDIRQFGFQLLFRTVLQPRTVLHQEQSFTKNSSSTRTVLDLEQFITNPNSVFHRFSLNQETRHDNSSIDVIPLCLQCVQYITVHPGLIMLNHNCVFVLHPPGSLATHDLLPHCVELHPILHQLLSIHIAQRLSST